MDIFASDFDGTLFYRKMRPPFLSCDIEKVRTFRKEGGLFGVCTGRSKIGITAAVPKDAFDFDFYILASGALILNSSFDVIRKLTVPRDLVQEIHEKYRGKVKIVIHANDTVYNFENDYAMQTHISSMDDIKGDDIYGLSFGAADEAEAAEICGEINSLYGDTVRAYVNVRNVDMVSRLCSKGTALDTVKAFFGAGRTGGIGDSYNDIPLLDAADRSYTFHRSPDKVKKHADAAVDTVGEAISDFSHRI